MQAKFHKINDISKLKQWQQGIATVFHIYFNLFAYLHKFSMANINHKFADAYKESENV